VIDIASAHTKLLNLKLLLERKISVLSLQIVVFVLYLCCILAGVDLGKRVADIVVEKHIFIRNVTVLFLAIDAVLVMAWVLFRRMPRAKNAEIGILFAIRTDNEILREKVKKDFVDAIRSQIRGFGIRIAAEVLSEYHTEKIIDHPDLLPKYHYRTGYKLIIHGNARARMHNGKEHYHIELDESIYHGRITDKLRRGLLRDMLAVFPRATLLPADNEFVGFKISSDLFSYGAMYILGLSCLYCGDVDAAYAFHSRLLSVNIESNVELIQQGYKRIRQNAKLMAFRELDFFARREYFEHHDLEKMGQFIDLAAQYRIEDYSFLLLAAIYYVKKGDVDSALVHLGRAKRVSAGDYTWAYSKAFLQAYKGNLRSAYSLYRLAFRNQAAQNAHIQCEKFMEETLQNEPNMYQLHYCLGLLFYHVHEDYDLSKKEFLAFLEADADQQQYSDFHVYAEEYVHKIDTMNA